MGPLGAHSEPPSALVIKCNLGQYNLPGRFWGRVRINAKFKLLKTHVLVKCLLLLHGNNNKVESMCFEFLKDKAFF